MNTYVLVVMALAAGASAGIPVSYIGSNLGLSSGLGLGSLGLGLDGGSSGLGLGKIGISLGGGDEGLGLGGGYGGEVKSVDYYTPAKYEFKYGVADPKTGDKKEQSEVRVGDVVKGEYSLAEPDGTIRVVKYTADGKNGFNAIVSRIGKAVHPQKVILTKGIALSGGLGLGGLSGGY